MENQNKPIYTAPGNQEKIDLLKKYLSDYDDLKIIVVYFDDFNDNLSKKSLNLFLKSVIKP